jgi:hypothetical protein
VGFSYCDPVGPTGNGYSCGNWNDSLVATTNRDFLKAWIRAFPEYAENPMYITGMIVALRSVHAARSVLCSDSPFIVLVCCAGESYAGVYVPVIVRAILEDPDSGLNIKGFAVGDGCMGNDVLCGSGGPYNGPYCTRAPCPALPPLRRCVCAFV